MLLQMNPSGQVVGGFVHNYLLEKNRVITQAAGERNFHCFYNLLAGASKADKAEWHLEDATKYAFLQHEQRTIHGVNDRTEFADLGHHMTAVGIADDDQRQIYQQLAAILHLGNVVFVSQVDASHNPCCAIDVNKGIHNPSRASQTVGILDIYGFEIFHENLFEQLCINYVNEKLQQLFISQTLQSEQLEYKREGIAWVNIQFFNNQVVCDLIEDAKMPGIFPLLDEQCAISQTSVDVLMHRFNETYVKEPHFIKSRVKGSVFSVRHYAGVVEYDLSHFAEANIDSFFTELYTELQKSSNAFVRNLLKDERSNKEKLKRPPSTSFQFRAQVNALVQDLNMCNPHYVRCIKPNENKISGSINKQLVTAQVQCLGLVENIRVRRAGFCYRETYATFLHRYKILSRTSWPAVHNCSSLLTAEDVGVLPSLQPVSAQREAEANGQQRPLTPLEVYHMHLAAKNNKPTDGHEVPQPIIRFKEDIESLGCFSLGRNKVFIKHPAALFSLERLRQDKLPQIAKIIEDAWVRRLDRLMRRHGAADKATVAGLYSHWDQLASKVLQPASRLRSHLAAGEVYNAASFLTSYAKRNAAVRHLNKVKKAVQVFSSRLFGKKKRRRDTLDRVYLGDYLNVKKHTPLLALLKASKESHVLFAGETHKINEKFVAQTRLLLIGEMNVHNIKADKMDKPKERRVVPIAQLSKISMSSLHDNYLFLHVNNDVGLMYEVDQKTEVVGDVTSVKRSTVHKKSAVEVQLEEAITRDDDELAPTGLLLALTQGVGTVSGLRDASLNSTVHVFDEDRQVVGQGVVLHLQKKRAVVAFFGDASRMSLGMEVELIDNDLTIPVGGDLLGRVVDPLGQAMDSAPPLAPSTPRLPCMRSTIPSMMDRGMLKEPWTTGIQVIDCLHPLAYGHRFGILGPR
ncbi:hypothetical protein DYB38_005348 [Aphanomyces astaci]|uniref:Myosin motor domain-containing protein n=1 Tax=Aphanomyces astaci TaxID=112090 RepID=A0A397E2T2_APHAT|nr:hypothetical protein DYB38_005348 [Aphanomyces astaci]